MQLFSLSLCLASDAAFETCMPAFPHCILMILPATSPSSISLTLGYKYRSSAYIDQVQILYFGLLNISFLWMCQFKDCIFSVIRNPLYRVQGQSISKFTTMRKPGKVRLRNCSQRSYNRNGEVIISVCCCSVLMRPHWECCAQCWASQYQGDADKQVQWRATRRLLRVWSTCCLRGPGSWLNLTWEQADLCGGSQVLLRDAEEGQEAVVTVGGWVSPKEGWGKTSSLGVLLCEEVTLRSCGITNLGSFPNSAGQGL